MRVCEQSLSVVVLLTAVSALAAPPEYPLLSEGQRDFLSLPRNDREHRLLDRSSREKLLALGDKPLSVTLPCAASNTITIREASLSGGPHRIWHIGSITVNAPQYLLITAADGGIRLGNLKIATQYRWHSGDGPWREFVTAATPPRLMRVGKIANFRDVGGRIGYDGRRVRQGMIYRCAELNGYAGGRRAGKLFLDAASRRYLTENLGVRTELDLRAGRDVRGMTGSPAGETVAWQHVSFAFYAELHTESGRNAARKVLELLLDGANYPLLFHCISGQDRTGTVALLINALLGVDEEELYRDWEVSVFANADTRFNHRDRFYKLIASFDRYPGSTLNRRIEAFVLSLGFSRVQLEQWREMMMESEQKQ